MKFMKNQIFYLVVCFVFFGYAQERNQSNDTLDTQTINVIKPYVPSVSDAFRINNLPKVNASDFESIENVRYNIFSIPVASTFTPEKGAPEKVKRIGSKEGASNFFSLAAGNYLNIEANGFLGLEIDEISSFSTSLYHNSSSGGIKSVELKDSFSTSKLSLGREKLISKQPPTNHDCKPSIDHARWSLKDGVQAGLHNVTKID